MKSAFIFLVLILTACLNETKDTSKLHLDKSENFEEEISSFKIDNERQLVLKQKRKIGKGNYEPFYKDRVILFNEKDSLLLDHIIDTTVLFSPAFSFFESNAKVLNDNPKSTLIEILLGQAQCSGDFCHDFIVVELLINKQNNRLSYTISSDYR